MSRRRSPPASLENVQEFTQRWHGEADFEVLYDGRVDGKKILPNASERQSDLIEMTLDVALETVLLDRLERRESPATLRKMGLIKRGGEQTVDSCIDGKISPLDAVNQLRKAGKIQRANDLAKPQKMQAFYDETARFQAEMDDFQRELQDWRDGHTDVMPSLPKKEQPVDPRVKNFNEHYGSNAIKIRDTGEKTRHGTRAKLGRKHCTASVLRDINRITVIPRSVAIGDSFVKILEERYKDKGYEGLPRTFIEPFKISASGCMDRKCSVVIKNGFEERKNQGLPLGAVSEIKIEGPEMLKADIDTHRAFRMLRTISKGEIPSMETFHKEYEETEVNDRPKSQWARIHRNLQGTIAYYDRLEKTTGIGNDELPQIPDKLEDFTPKQAYEAIDGVRELNRNIYLKAAERSTDDWKVKFIEVAYDTIDALKKERDPVKQERALAGFIAEEKIDALVETLSNERDKENLQASREEVRSAGKRTR
jgi:hypothetical protein